MADQRPIVVLGGTGWTGRHVTAAFAGAGHEVISVSRGSGPPPVTGRCASLDLVTTPVPELAARFRQWNPATVVNASGTLWGATETEMRESFVTATRNVLRAIEAVPGRPRFIQLGTVMEYGPSTPHGIFDERLTARPTGPYGRTKLAATRLVVDATVTGRVDGLVLRLVNAAGPGTPRPSLLGLVADRLRAAAEAGTEAVVELTPLTAHRDYIDIRDAADAVVAAAESPQRGRIVNVGTGRAVPVRWLVDTLIAMSGVPGRVVEKAPPPGQSASTGAGGEWLQIDPRTATDLLGWTARRSLDEALRDHWREVVPAAV